MGTQARWFRARWRYRVGDDLGWTYADTLADCKADVKRRQERVVIERRVRGGYEHHSVLQRRD